MDYANIAKCNCNQCCTGGKMNNYYRRKRLLNILQESTEPIAGAMLAKQLNVTRQLIVSDIAILHSSGITIVSSTRGYEYLDPEKQKGFKRALIYRGKDLDINELQNELDTVVDNGGIVCSININSQIYGELKIELNIHSRRDVRQYLEKIQNAGHPFIAVVTGGVHELNVDAHNEEELQAIEEGLDELGLLEKTVNLNQ